MRWEISWGDKPIGAYERDLPFGDSYALASCVRCGTLTRVDLRCDACGAASLLSQQQAVPVAAGVH